MKLFGSNGVIDTADFEFYNKGTCANIYKKDKLILKKYKLDCSYSSMISTKVFQRLKENDIPHIVKLYDSYYNDISFLNRFLKMDAYTMKYAGEDIDSLLNSPSDYFLEMVLALEHILPLLTKTRILLNDMNAYNIIFSKDDVTIIDPDSFYISNFHSSSYILRNNQGALMEYVLSPLIREAWKLREEVGFIFDICSLRMLSLDSVSSSLASVFTEKTPYLSLKKRRS